MSAREVQFAEVEFYGGPWDGRRLALALPLASGYRVPRTLPHTAYRGGHDPLDAPPHTLATWTYRLRPCPRGLRYELERER